VLSFTNYSYVLPDAKFIGLKNYFILFGNATYWKILANTVVISFFSVLGMTVFGMTIALLLNQAIRGVKIFRGLALVCWAVPALAGAIIWMLILNEQYGILNHLLIVAGVIDETIPWSSHWLWAKVSVCMVFIWRGTPFLMVTFLAALKTIPDDVIDAAKIDGAGPIRRFINITIPTIRPIVMIVTLLQVIAVFQNYIIIMTITSGGPANATKTLIIQAYEYAFDAWKMGRASALGVTWLLFLLVFSIFYIRFVGGKEQKIY
jgi:multiple sugar transport system permease protein